MTYNVSSGTLTLIHLHTPFKREVAQQLHYTHHLASLMVSRYTTLVPFLRLRIEPVREAGLGAGIRICRPTREIKKERRPISRFISVRYKIWPVTASMNWYAIYGMVLFPMTFSDL